MHLLGVSFPMLPYGNPVVLTTALTLARHLAARRGLSSQVIGR